MDENAGRRGAATRRRRADAQRSIEAILDATLAGINSDGDLNMTAIAHAAGVSRVTLYAHFPSRADLLDGALRRALEQLTAVLPDVSPDDDSAPEALARLLRHSWQALARQRNLYTAATATLSPAQLRNHHEQVLSSIDALVVRGQAAGDFRSDLPQVWLITAIYTLLHAAAEELNAGRLAADQAGDVVTTSILSLLRPQAG